jgi:predicted amidohydrolase YtcJ
VSALLLRGGEVDDRPADVLVDHDRVVDVGPDLRPDGPHDVLDVGGGAVLPGLHDHHLHLLAMAAARRSLDVGALRSPEAFDAALAASAASRVVGYHEHDHGPLDAERAGARRIQHATGAAWFTAADGWRYGPNPPADVDPPDLAAVGAELLAVGVTGVTDATPFTDAAAVRLLAEARLPQRVVVTGGLELPVDDVLPRGPVKLVIADHEVPDLDGLSAAIALAHDRGRPVAVHCVTSAALALLLAAWEAVGPRAGDRLEHGAVIPPSAIEPLRRLGVTVVTQPNLVRERGHRYRVEVDPVDQPDLWRCGSLLAAGVPVGGSTDAPFGRPDPWAAMAAAVDRDGEAVTPEQALGLFLAPLDDPGGPPRRVRPGGPADLCVLDRPWADARADLSAVAVTHTATAVLDHSG